jgi:hypothetical protein
MNRILYFTHWFGSNRTFQIICEAAWRPFQHWNHGSTLTKESNFFFFGIMASATTILSFRHLQYRWIIKHPKNQKSVVFFLSAQTINNEMLIKQNLPAFCFKSFPYTGSVGSCDCRTFPGNSSPCSASHDLSLGGPKTSQLLICSPDSWILVQYN